MWCWPEIPLSGSSFAASCDLCRSASSCSYSGKPAKMILSLKVRTSGKAVGTGSLSRSQPYGSFGTKALAHLVHLHVRSCAAWVWGC